MTTNLKSPVYVLDVAWGETISLAFSHSTRNIRLFGRWSWEHYKLLDLPPRYPHLVSDETLPSLWRWLRAETSMERSECTLADIGRVISSPDQIVGTCPGALSKNRVWTPSLGKLGPPIGVPIRLLGVGITSLLSTVFQLNSVFLVKVSRICFSI